MTSFGPSPLPTSEPSPAGLPTLTPAHLPRSRLVHTLLDEPRQLGLVYAPPGYGKTALLAEAAHSLAASARCAWLSLAGQPLSLAQFLARLASSLGVRAEEQALLETIGSSPAPLFIVLDDYPQPADPALDAWIDQLLQRAPGLRLLVSSRYRPNWNLPRLLLDGELHELTAQQLAFTAEEFSQLLELGSPGLPPHSREALWAQTHGWCAGVRLLMNSGECANGNHWLRDYLRHELLPRLPVEQHDLLFGLAHLGRASHELCARIWEDANGAQQFHNLLSQQSLLVPVEHASGWYRLLSPVAQALASEHSDSSLARLRLRACRALADLGLHDEAIEQALGAGRPEVAVSFIDHLKFDWLLTHQHLRNLLQWRDQMPTALLESTPRLVGLQSRALLVSWRLEEAEATMNQLAAYLPQPSASWNCRLLANWQALHGMLMGMLGRTREAREHCQAALVDLAPRDWRSAYLCHSTLARISMATGDYVHAESQIHSALELARRHDCLATELLANTDQARMLLLGGDLGQAEALIRECRDLLEDQPRYGLLRGRLDMLEGELALLQGRTEVAEQLFHAGLYHARASADPLMLHACLGLAEAAAARTDLEAARRHIHEAERHMQRGKVHISCYRAAIDQQRGRLLVYQQEWQALLKLMHKVEAQLHEQTPSPSIYAPSLHHRCQLLMAVAEHGVGRSEEARLRLLRLAQECQRLQRNLLYSEVRVVLARIELELGKARSNDCEEAISVLASNNLFRLWAERLSPLRSSDTAHVGPDLPEPDLTAREKVVLQLMAAGLSNQEIGEHLFISSNTVKTHTSRINVKLGVKRRTQAVAHARALGLLS
ncbi:ATP-dependent transcriptional regulator [Pseudomonas sp. BN414]|uniref:LuxR C-terminal-related transcriptional regulator n=1 Tax=Pseudomonas sp. BN414 TaxID=2567888 RepID=UPI002458A32A|nr:LuxR C-terminal-related transcriptional regulator [Pseudomonas sp. BN414]MDH4569659.1 ATP-dependent transcriptional regulator [Pseudomonas sp. BN414]